VSQNGMIRKNMIKIQEQMDNSSEQIQYTTSTNEKVYKKNLMQRGATNEAVKVYKN
jgi:hypothetical protein